MMSSSGGSDFGNFAFHAMSYRMSSPLNTIRLREGALPEAETGSFDQPARSYRDRIFRRISVSSRLRLIVPSIFVPSALSGPIRFMISADAPDRDISLTQAFI